MFYWNRKIIIDITNGFYVANDWLSTTNKFSIDTRTLNSGDIFIALKGENFDGHDFVLDAFRKGAIVAIVNKSFNDDVGFPLIFVENTLVSMQRMANYYVTHILKSKIIAVTGSVGKTTTKDMLTQVFSYYGTTECTKGNFNNDIGMPLSILNVSQEVEFLILEMGMRGYGEIKKLSMIASPHLAIITNVEPVHLAFFKSLLDIVKAKSEIFYGLREDSTIILNSDNKYYTDFVCRSYNFENIKYKISVGKGGNVDIKLADITIFGGNVNFNIEIKNNNFKCSMSDRRKHLAYNAVFVFAAVYALNLDVSKIPNILKSFTLSDGRGKVMSIRYFDKSFTLIDDSYNASPFSVKVALEGLSYYSNRKVVILGDMLELGNNSVKYHSELLEHIYSYNIDKVYTVGSKMKVLYKLLSKGVRGKHFDYAEKLLPELTSIFQENDIILIKGSHSTNLYKVVEKIINQQH